jgi:hypothetical protein
MGYHHQPAIRRRGLLGLALLLATVNAGSLPARADDAAIRVPTQWVMGIDGLKQRIEALEQQLAESKKTPPAVDADALKVKNGSRLQVSGYAQMRYTNIGSQASDRTANNATDFQVARLRPRFNYAFDRHFLASLQLNATTRGTATTNVTTRDAFLEYDNPGRVGSYARAGQQKLPFGWEVFREGDEARAALERARIFGIVFPDNRDIGFTVGMLPHSPRSPIVALGVVNGDGINHTDGDKQKSFAANAIVPLGAHNVVGGSVYSGTTTATVGGKLTSQVKRAYGVEHRLNSGRLSTQLEYVWGRAFGADLNGGYGQIAVSAGPPGTLFVRHDVFDPNEHAAHDYWRRTSIGWYKDLTRQFRLTGEYDIIRDGALGAHPHANEFGVQLQGNF